MWVKLSKDAAVRYVNLDVQSAVEVGQTPGGGLLVTVRAPLRHLTFTGRDAGVLLAALDDAAQWDASVDYDGDGADGTPANGEGDPR